MKTITTDQGTQFKSSLFATLATLIGAHRIRTTAQHPATNGMIEWYFRVPKASLMCCRNTPWLTLLPTVLLCLRTAYRADIKTFAAEMLYGTALRLPSIEKLQAAFISRDPVTQPPFRTYT